MSNQTALKVDFESQMDPLTEEDGARLDYLLAFLAIAQNGLVKPYDPSPIIEKVSKLGRNNTDLDITDVIKCCPPCGDIRDSKDFKPYVGPALKQIAKILKLEPEEHDNNRYHSNRY